MGAVPQLRVPLPSSEEEKKKGKEDKVGKMGRREIGRERIVRKQKYQGIQCPFLASVNAIYVWHINIQADKRVRHTIIIFYKKQSINWNIVQECTLRTCPKPPQPSRSFTLVTLFLKLQ